MTTTATAVTDAERAARVTLSAMPESFLGASVRASLNRASRRAETIVAGLAAQDDGIGAAVRGIDADKILTQAAERGMRYVVPGDQEWPTGLNALSLTGITRPTYGYDVADGAPLGLWVSGTAHLATAVRGSVAIVGARAATAYGVSTAAEFAATIGTSGRAIVSGAAFGIDVAAHRGALAAHAPTVAVLACGADRAYPAAHTGLLETIRKNGAVVSEYLPGTTPTRSRFLSRNRLIAALSVGTVVVEAASRSGSMDAARWARELNRVVMAVPGPITSALSRGPHELLRHRHASLVTSAADVLDCIG